MATVIEAWDCQPGEGPKAWAAFCIYRDMGAATRSLSRVAREFDKSRVLMGRWSSRWRWVGKRGILTANSILQMLRRRGHEAGVPHVYTHLFRHTYAHEMLADGMQEGDLMHLMGHRSTTLIHSLYGASAAVGRARIAYRKHSPGDRL
jgi:integrase